MEATTGKQEEAYYSQGLDTWAVPMSMHKENRERLRQRFLDSEEGVPARSFVLLEGGKQTTRHDTDHEDLFRQESFFQYLFGCSESELYGAIDLTTGHSYLFMPRLPEEYAVWMGKIHPPEYLKQKYGVDDVFYVEDLEAKFTEWKASVLYVLNGLNTDSGNYAKPATFPGIEKFRVDNGRLHPELVECRVFKTAKEVELLRYVCKASSEAHITVMKAVKPGMTEYQLESLFLHEIYSRFGCRHVSYSCICGSGPNGAILHYGTARCPNDKLIRDGDMLLMDMGGEYHCYGSDITCSYPANGKFTDKQRFVYETVLAAVQAVEKAMKPGVSYPDMHRLAERVILTELTKYGLLRGSVDDMMKHYIANLFMPHGLGHFLGLDTHDVGGYPRGAKRSSEPGLRSLRCGRVLAEGMVLTVEPGLYFIDAVLSKALNNPEQAQFLVAEKIKEFMDFGGVRLEDDVLVTADGIEVLSQVPRAVEEIEAIMATGANFVPSTNH
ncbi:Peptidase D [Balamuthia mandrillaris]